MINMAQVAVSASTVTPVAAVPGGPCQVTITNNDSTNFVTLGNATVSATHGYELDAGKSVTFSTFPGSTGIEIYGLAHTAAVNVSTLISTNN